MKSNIFKIKKSLNVFYCLICLYKSFCVEICGNSYKTNRKPVYMQKKALRIINASPFCHPANELFLTLHPFKCNHLEELRTAMTLRPRCTQKWF